MKKYSAFTLIEILVVLSIVTALGFFIVPVSINQLVFARLDSTASTIVTSIYKQQQNNFSGYQDSEYGVVVNSNSIVLYSGPSANAALDSSVITFDGVNISTNLASNTVHFENGLIPSSTGSIYISSDGKTSEVVVNSYGLVYVNQ